MHTCPSSRQEGLADKSLQVLLLVSFGTAVAVSLVVGIMSAICVGKPSLDMDKSEVRCEMFCCRITCLVICDWFGIWGMFP